MASTLAVIAYPAQPTAGEAAALARMQKEFLIELDDVWIKEVPRAIPTGARRCS